MATQDLLVRIAADLSGFDRATQRAVSKIKSLASDMQSVGSALSLSVTAPLVGFAGVALKAAGDLDSLKRGLDTVSGSAANTAKQMAELREVAKLPGLGFAEAVQGAIRLQSVGFSAGGAAKVLREFGNAIASAGGGKDDLNRVIVQLGQMANSSKVLSQDLRPIIQQVPQVAAVLRKEFGTIDTEVLQKMGISSKKMIETIIEGLGKLPRVTGGIKNDFENLKDTIDQSLAEAGSALAPFATKLLNDMVLPSLTALKNLAEGFKGLNSGTQTAIVAIGGLAVAAPPTIFAIGAITNAALTLTSVATKLAGTAFFAGAINVAPWVALAAALGFVVEKLYSLNSVSERMANLQKQQTKNAADLNAQWKLEHYGIQQSTNARANAIGGILEFVDAQNSSTAATGKNTSALGLNEVAAIGAGKAISKFAQMSKDILESTMRPSLEATAKWLDDLNEKSKIVGDTMAKEFGISSITAEEMNANLQAAYDSLDDLNGNFHDVFAVARKEISSTSAYLQGLIDQFKQATSFHMDSSITNGSMRPSLEQEAAEVEKATQKAESVAERFQKQVSLIINDISRDITDLIFKGGKLKDVLAGTFESIGKAIVRAAIENQLKKIAKVMTDMVGTGGKLGKVLGGVFGGGGAATATTGVIKNASGSVSDAAGAVSNGAGSAVSAAGSASSGILGMIGIGAQVASAVSSVIGNFQMAGMNKSLDLIVNHTLRTANQLIEGLQPQINTYLPYLQMIHARLATITDSGINVRGGAGGGGDVYVRVEGADAAALIRQLKQMGAIA